MRRAVCVAASLLLSVSAVAEAQESAPSPPVSRVVARARGLIENGAGADARVLLDSLVGTLSPASNDLAEALYWRATLAERASDAERDWKRLTIEAPLSPRAADALVRLGEFELLRGRPGTARPYFDRVVRDFANTTQRVKATLWTVRSYNDERNTADGCAALASLPVGDVPDGELRLQYEELGKVCKSENASSKNVKPSNATPKETVAEKGRYSVQLAAYDTRAEAEASVKRLSARGMDVRIDGDEKPFRIRTGRFATRAEASALLAKLKKQGTDGFVAELRP